MNIIFNFFIFMNEILFLLTDMKIINFNSIFLLFLLIGIIFLLFYKENRINNYINNFYHYYS